MLRTLRITMLLTAILGAAALSSSQTNPTLQTYFKDFTELSDDQIASIRSGQAVSKTLHSRTPDEIFVFGADDCRNATERRLPREKLV